jgi:hypothetical protein
MVASMTAKKYEEEMSKFVHIQSKDQLGIGPILQNIKYVHLTCTC